MSYFKAKMHQIRFQTSQSSKPLQRQQFELENMTGEMVTQYTFVSTHLDIARNSIPQVPATLRSVVEYGLRFNDREHCVVRDVHIYRRTAEVGYGGRQTQTGLQRGSIDQ